MPMGTDELYEFGAFRVDVGQHTLERIDGAKNGSLPEKAFQTLIVLIRNSGKLVTKEQLIQFVWPDTIVEDNNLDKCIWAVRQFLGETPGEQKYIETVRKHGYRFVAEVRRVQSEYEIVSSEQENGSSKELENSSVESLLSRSEIDQKAEGEIVDELNSTPSWIESRFSLKSHILSVGFMLAALLIGAVAVGYYFYPGKRPGGVDGQKTFAVLTPKPIDTANRDGRYEESIADALIIRLNSTKGFLVRPLSSVRQYNDIAQDPLAAGREQQVDYVVASHYQLAHGRIRFTYQLFTVATGQVEAFKTSETDTNDLFAMLDALAGDVGIALQMRFGTTPPRSKARAATSSEEAYMLFLGGKNLLDKRDPDLARNAISKFEQAVRLDPNYGQAWAGIALAHRLIGGMRRDTDRAAESRMSIDAVNKALALNENLADPHTALCDNKMQYEWDWNGAERECKRAIELDPNSGMAHDTYSRFLFGRGRFKESMIESKTAIDLEPTSLFIQRNYGVSLYYSGRYAEAVTQLKRVIDIDPSFTGAVPFLCQSLEMQGNYSEAFEWLITMLKGNESIIQVYKSAYQTSGWPGVMLERAKSLENSNVVYFQVAVAYAKAGDKDKAFEYLEKSFEHRELWMANLNVDPALDSIRDDPRFDDLVRRVGV